MEEEKLIRQRLVAQGPQTLSDAELLSVLMGEGAGGVASPEIARQAMAEAGGLYALSQSEVRKLRVTAGMGMKRAAVVAAAFELGRRLACVAAETPSTIRSNDDVTAIFRPQMASLPHEEFWVLYLSSANTVIEKGRVSQGGVSGTAVDHRIIVKRAVEVLASGLILVHNHPSGVATPSGDDRTLTDKISEAAALFDIAVLDHLIITAGDCFSFRQSGLIA